MVDTCTNTVMWEQGRNRVLRLGPPPAASTCAGTPSCASMAAVNDQEPLVLCEWGNELSHLQVKGGVASAAGRLRMLVIG